MVDLHGNCQGKGFFCNGSPRPPYSPSPEPLSPSSKNKKSKIENS